MSQSELRCPGQNTMFWKPDDIYDVKCPNCGKAVEFWKDDSKRSCRCGHRFLNPKRNLGCLEYCKYAESCMPEMFEGENLSALYRDRLLAAMRKALKPGDEKLEQCREISELVEEINEAEGGTPKVVIAAAMLANLADSGSEDEARAMLRDLGTEGEVIDQVCRIISGGGDLNGSAEENAMIVWDAMNLFKLLQRRSLLDRPARENLIDRKLHTATGRRMARERLLA